MELFRKEYQDHLSHDKVDASIEAKTFFESHDIAHVLFGCDISLYGEGVVKIWTLFGTTLGFWKHIRGYQDANAYALSKDFDLAHILRNLLKFLIAIPTIIFRAKQMSKPWNWDEFEPYLDTPIVQIRREFNINILKS